MGTFINISHDKDGKAAIDPIEQKKSQDTDKPSFIQRVFGSFNANKTTSQEAQDIKDRYNQVVQSQKTISDDELTDYLNEPADTLTAKNRFGGNL